MSRPLCYGDFSRTGTQDCQNVINSHEYYDSWITLGRPTDPEACVNIVRHAHAEAFEDSADWIKQQHDDFEGLDPMLAYQAWRDAWESQARTYVKRWVLDWADDWRNDHGTS